MTDRKFLLARIGWTRGYGLYGFERPINGGAFNTGDVGSEVWNFLPFGDRLYGYVQPPRQWINLKRIEADCDGQAVEGCTVIFLATSPLRGKQRVVGWYAEATVQAEASERPRHSRRDLNTPASLFNIEAPLQKACLLPEEYRSHYIPRGKGMPGQSQIYYGLDEKLNEREAVWISELWEYIDAYEGPNLLLLGQKSSVQSGAGRGRSPGPSPSDLDYTEQEAMEKSAGNSRAPGLDYKNARVFCLDEIAEAAIGTRSSDFHAAVRRLSSSSETTGIDLVAFAGGRRFYETLVDSLAGQIVAVRIVLPLPAGATRNTVSYLCQDSRFRCRQLLPVSEAQLMHVKLALFAQKKGGHIAIIGSSNHTAGGLGRNREYNVAFFFQPGAVGDPADYFEKLWQAAREPVDPEMFAEAMDVAEISPPQHQPLTESPTTARNPLFFQQRPIREVAAFVQQSFRLRSTKGGRAGTMLIMPTGAGKTFTTIQGIVESGIDLRNSRILWLSHRRELLEQAVHHWAQALQSYPEDVNINDVFRYSFGKVYPEKNIEGNIILHGSGVAYRRLAILRKREYDLIVVDEAHRGGEATLQYGSLLKELEFKAVIGITATPYRSGDVDARELSAFFRNPSIAVTAAEVRDQVKTSDSPVFATFDNRTIETGFRASLNSDDELQLSSELHQFDNQDRNQKIVDSYFDLSADFRKAIIFATSCAHANRLASMINARSKEAQAFHLGEVNPEASLIPLEATDRGITALRPAIVRRFRSGDIRCLVSVLLLTEGFDAPEVDCLFLARPTYSTLLFSQMIGRGMRGPAMGGTERCILVNFVDDFVQIHQDRHQMLLSSHGLKTGLDVLDMDARDMDESEIQRVIEEQNRPSLKSRAGRLLLGEWFS